MKGKEHVLVTQFMAAIPVSVLKKSVTNPNASHDKIVFHGF
ncbi:hypothetical protein WH297_23965 [Ochrobactrum vermis]|uniref:Uncharacterized protein n=1 Tax=Ochrobactrum vermis TaxID=1827297 RepID=A0ABU8PL63_9HYPH|nr:hypothetical protein [Ochrobactrum vermis]